VTGAWAGDVDVATGFGEGIWPGASDVGRCCAGLGYMRRLCDFLGPCITLQMHGSVGGVEMVIKSIMGGK